MASVETGLYAELAAATSVTTLVSTRIHPGFAPATDSLPYLVYNRISTVPVGNLDGAATLEEVRVQLDAYASTSAGARAIADAVRGTLDGLEDTWSSKRVKIDWLDQDETPASEAGDEGARRYGVRQDYTIWHDL